MRFRRIHEGATYLMVLSAFGALALGGHLALPVVIAVLGAAALSARKATSTWDPRSRHLAWTVATLGALALCVLDFVLRGDLITATVHFLLFLLVNKLFNRHGGKDYLQIYAITFMMVVAGSVLNPGFSFAACFVIYVVATTWALSLFHLRREMEENYLIKHSTDRTSERVAVGRILNSRRIVGGAYLAGTSVISLTVFVAAVAVFLFFPRLDTPATAGPPRGAGPLTGFSGRLQLGDYGRLRTNPTTVLRVVLHDPPPGIDRTRLHLRGTTFDRYEAGRWYRSPTAPRPERLRQGRYLAIRWPVGPTPTPLPILARRALARATRVEVYQEPVGVDLLFAPGRPVAIDLRAKTGLRRPNFRVGPGGDLEADIGSRGGRYVLLADLRPPSPARLARSPDRPAPAAIAKAYLALPKNLPQRVRALAHRLTHGHTTRFARVVAIRDYLRSLRYSTRLRRPQGDPVDWFLFVRRAGHCEYFASAMTLLLRAVHIPARVVTGFLGGVPNPYGDYLLVRQGDAHAWVEVWFEGIGWVPFDPTPAAGQRPAPAQGFWSRAALLLDSLRMGWRRWVIEYDVHRQMRVLGWMRTRARALGRDVRGALRRHGVALGLLALGVLGLVLLGRRLRRRRGGRSGDSGPGAGSPQPAPQRRRAAQRELGKIEVALERLGVRRRPGETLLELARRADARLGDLASDAPPAAAPLPDAPRPVTQGPGAVPESAAGTACTAPAAPAATDDPSGQVLATLAKRYYAVCYGPETAPDAWDHLLADLRQTRHRLTRLASRRT